MDTGSRHNLMSECKYRNEFRYVKIERTEKKLKSFTNNKCEVVGVIELEVKYNEKTSPQRFVVVRNSICTLLGREFMRNFGLGITQINKVHTPEMRSKEQWFKEFEKGFSNELGCCKKGTVVSRKTMEALRSVFRKVRETPLAHRKEVKSEENVNDPVSRLRLESKISAAAEVSDVVYAVKEMGVPFEEKRLKYEHRKDREISTVLRALKKVSNG